MSVIYDRENDRLIYDRKLKDGPGDNMYGLEVCKSLNLPDDFLEMAHDIRNKYCRNFSSKSDSGGSNGGNESTCGIGSSSGLVIDYIPSQYNRLKLRGECEICRNAKGTEVHHLIYQKKINSEKNKQNKLIKNHKANLINICEACHNRIHTEGSELKIYKTTNGYEIM